jgi:hypothetical protein
VLDAATDAAVEGAKRSGSLLATPVRRRMEDAFGADFSGVKIHTGPQAARVNDRIQASAFTLGKHIFFRDGTPDAASAAGQGLLAHELTHTIQQGGSAARRPAPGAGEPVAGEAPEERKKQEAEGERAGNAAVTSMLTHVQRAATTMQREIVGGSEQTSGAPSTPVAPQKSAGAKGGWGKVSSAVDKSRSFNKGLRGTAVMEGVRAGVRAEQENQLGVAEGPEGKPRSDKTTHTAGGAWLANQMGRKDIIGDVEEYIPLSERSKHLGQFLTGAHAFITPQIHKNIHNLNEDPKSNWGGWGADYNFVAPLSKADELVTAAAAPGARGIFDLEKALGVPKGQWVNQCAPDYAIYRYKITDPEALNIRIPSGKERNAYGSWWKGDQFIEGEWNPGGSTSGGASEAVIDRISLDTLQSLGKDVLDIVLDASMSENTKRVLAEERGAAPAASSAPASQAPTVVAAPAATK